MENGPLRVQGLVNSNDTNITFTPNNYSWNHAANVLYIESGSGVQLNINIYYQLLINIKKKI